MSKLRKELIDFYERQDRIRRGQTGSVTRKPLEEYPLFNPHGYLPPVDEHVLAPDVNRRDIDCGGDERADRPSVSHALETHALETHDDHAFWFGVWVGFTTAVMVIAAISEFLK